jgi:hypothetical protein
VVPLTGSGIFALALALCVAIGAVVLLRPFAANLARRERSSEGAVPALMLVFLAAAIAIWVANPFAALLLVPALHLWLLALNPDLRLALPLRLVLVALGVVPVALIAAYYSVTLGYGPIDAIWTAALLIAGGAVTPLAVVEWSVVLGCVLGAFAITALTARETRPEPAEVTVRGPITYAGPGSLGGTESALRR